MPMTSRIAALALLLTVSFHLVATADSFRTVTLSGQPAPGTPAGVVFSGFRDAAITEDGVVVFLGNVSGPGVTIFAPSNDNGYWRDNSGVLTKIVRAGDQAVELPAGT